MLLTLNLDFRFVISYYLNTDTILELYQLINPYVDHLFHSLNLKQKYEIMI